MWLITKQLSESFTKNKKFANATYQNLKNKSSSSTKASNFEERKINVDGVDINYMKTGVGEHPILLLPGSMGSIWTDFKPQVENLNKEKLTIVSWDPPGYGKSRPPNRTFPDGYFKRDARLAFNLMKTLGYDQFSLLGWSDGGITSFFLAAQYREHIHKLIVLATHAYIVPEEIEIYEKLRNIDKWSERMRAPLHKLYGDKYFRETWSNWVDAKRNIFEKYNGDICTKELAEIKCPTLIVHGERDPIVFRGHPDYLKRSIKNSRIEFFKDGGHNLHLRYPDEFNALVNKFLTQ